MRNGIVIGGYHIQGGTLGVVVRPNTNPLMNIGPTAGHRLYLRRICDCLERQIIKGIDVLFRSEHSGLSGSGC